VGQFSTTVNSVQLVGAFHHAEWALEAQYFGLNNERLATPYAVVNAGVAVPLRVGKIVMALTNAGNSGTSNGYADLTHSQAYATIAGAPVLLPARPVLPRALTVGYRVDIGRH